MKKLSNLLNEELNISNKERQKKQQNEYDSLLREHLYNIRMDLRKFVNCVSKDLNKFKGAMSANKNHKVANVLNESLFKKAKKLRIKEFNEANWTDILDELSFIRTNTNNQKVVKVVDQTENMLTEAVDQLQKYFGFDWDEMLYCCSEEENDWAQNIMSETNAQLQENMKKISSFIGKRKTNSLIKEHFPSIAQRFSHILDGMPGNLQEKMMSDLSFFMQVRKSLNDKERIDPIIISHLDL